MTKITRLGSILFLVVFKMSIHDSWGSSRNTYGNDDTNAGVLPQSKKIPYKKPNWRGKKTLSEEDKTNIKEIIKDYRHDWKSIQRKVRRVFERWFSIPYLKKILNNSDIGKDRYLFYTSPMDAQLKILYTKHGLDWNEIACGLLGEYPEEFEKLSKEEAARSAKNRFYYMMKHKMIPEVREQTPSEPFSEGFFKQSPQLHPLFFIANPKAHRRTDFGQ